MQIQDISHIPQTPWVYFFKDQKGEILYIGKAKNLYKRLSQYFTPGSVRKQEMLSKATHIDFLQVENESESLYLESNLIKKHLPPFNNMLKGANAYAYIKLTKHPIPQVLITRKKLNDGATYIWPKHNTQQLKKFLQYLRQIVQFRTCPLSQFNQKKLCSDYYFKLCQGRCGLPNLPKPDYAKLITSFFRGNTKPIEKQIKKLIDDAVKLEHFERAAKLRDIYLQIDQFVERQSVELSKNATSSLLMMREIGKRRVYVLLNFFEGRLIDVIRHHFDAEDVDQETMLASLEGEFGDFQKQEKRYATSPFKLTKEESERISQLFENFFESYLLGKTLQGGSVMTQLLETLQHRYQLSQFPYQIECLDISHLQGSHTSWGLTCMVGGLEEKKFWRKYKIQTVQNDDYLALLEVLKRRFDLGKLKWEEVFMPEILEVEAGSRYGLHLPNLFILDGGKGQLNILHQLLEHSPAFAKLFETVQFCALGKGEARQKAKIWKKSKKADQLVGEKLYVWKNWTILEFDLVYDEADKLLIKLRDSAHRFANYYRKQQEKAEFRQHSASFSSSKKCTQKSKQF